MSIEAIRRLAAAVQHNCDLADAHHAQAMSLCAYLLDMREYFRWQHDLPLGAVLERSRLGPWIAAREAAWETLRDDDAAAYRGLGDLPDAACAAHDDPFDEAGADACLAGLGLAYGAGIGRFGRPVFVLAERLGHEVRDGVRIVVTGRELARGLTTPPAVSRDGRVLIRLDATERWLWAKYEEWQHHSHDHGFAAAWAGYAEAGADPVATVRAMARGELETLIRHELGEIAAGAMLGEDWEEMLEAVADRPDSRRAEMFVRSLRDLLADCTTTLPALLAGAPARSLHFWFGNFDGMRKALAPALQTAYLAWCGGDRAALAEAVAAGAGHWRAACERLLARWRDGGEAAVDADAHTPDGYLQA